MVGSTNQWVRSLLLVTALSTLGCSGSSFNGDNAPKPVAQKDPNFSNGNPLLQNDAFGDSNGGPGVFGDNSNQLNSPSLIPVIKVCSDRQSESQGTNVVQAQGVSVKLVDQAGKHYLLQADPGEIKNSIRFQNSATVVLPSGVPDGQYLALFCDVAYAAGCGAGATAASSASTTVINPKFASRTSGLNSGTRYGSLGSGSVTVQGGQVLAASPVRLTYFINPQNAQMMNMFQGMFTGMMSQASPEAAPFASMMGAMMPQSYNPTQQQMAIAAECQDNSSPLMVDLSDGRGLQLTSPDNGVEFDIDGDGVKDQISWVAHDNIGILAIDIDGNGTIDNVHELFGNNTRGPDDALAANGFAALAKYDDNNDHRIDSKDKIFSVLKLWIDTDMDGVSQSHELHSLTAKQVSYIDLSYTQGLEEDIYGNQSRERSLLKMESGEEKTLIDVWFLPKQDEKTI